MQGVPPPALEVIHATRGLRRGRRRLTGPGIGCKGRLPAYARAGAGVDDSNGGGGNVNVNVTSESDHALTELADITRTTLDVLKRGQDNGALLALHSI